jgi:methanogenic corrinoid protein MtbC1
MSTARGGQLLATIEHRVIPELLLAHCSDPSCRKFPADSRLPTESEVIELTTLACDGLASTLVFIEALAREGISLPTLLLELVAPAARLLGTQWESDERSFSDVTVGLGTLQQIVHVLGPTFAPGIGHRGLVVLVSLRSDQHTLGLHILGEFLRRAGWGVHVAPGMPEAELRTLVASERVEMVGISARNSDGFEALARLVASVRASSLNPDVAIMLGGSGELAARAQQLGATFCADPPAAVQWLDRLGCPVDGTRRRCGYCGASPELAGGPEEASMREAHAPTDDPSMGLCRPRSAAGRRRPAHPVV